LLILMKNPLLMEPNHHSVLLKLMRVISSQPAASQASLQQLFQTFTRAQMMHAVGLSQQFLTIHLCESRQVDSAVEAATKLLSLLHAANQVVRRCVCVIPPLAASLRLPHSLLSLTHIHPFSLTHHSTPLC
jgi:hypothetical protein